MSSTLREASVLKAVADIIREHVGKAVDSLKARMDGLMEGVTREIAELRQAVEVRPERGDKGDPGDSVTAEDVLPILKADVDEYLLSIEPPKDGKSVTADDVLPALKAEAIEFVAEFLENLKPPKDGKSITVEDVTPLIESMRDRWALEFERRANDVLQRVIERIPAPKDGKDSDPDLVAAKVIERLDLKGTRADIKKMCKEIAESAVAAIPKPHDGKDADPITDEQIDAVVKAYLQNHPPKDGKSVTIDDVMPKLESELQAAVCAIPIPKDGASVSIEDVMPVLAAKVDKFLAEIRIPEDGKDADPPSQDMVSACVEKYLQENPLPTPSDGKDADPVSDDQVFQSVEKYLRANPPKDGERGKDAEISEEMIAAVVAKHLENNPPKNGEDGTSITADDVMPELRAELQKAIDGIPVPKDGNSVSIEDVMPALAEKVEKFLSEIQPAKDGKDGADGKDGESVTPEQIDALLEKRLSARVAEWALDFEKRAQDQLQKAVDRIEKPKDGKDGFSLEHFDVRSDDGGRTWILSFDDGQRREERTIVTEMPKYREIWKPDVEYTKGDMVTYSGSTWVCLKSDKGDKPGTYSKSWRLCVKKGRDGPSK